MENQEYKKMVLLLDAGVAGTDSAEFLLVRKNTSQEDLAEAGWERACDWASQFGVYPEGDHPDDEDDKNYTYSDDICYTWVEYDPMKHDMLRIGNDESWQKYN